MRRRTNDEADATLQLDGACHWCKRTGVTVTRGRFDSYTYCADTPACYAARFRMLVVDGKRPRSWYAELAAGRYENRRDCRKNGMTNDDIKAVCDSMSLAYAPERARVINNDNNEEDTTE